MRLRTLVGLERQKIEDEYAALLKTIAELQDILASERRLLGVVRTETEDLKKRLGDERKTPVEALEGELSIEDIIEDTEVVVTVTVGGYIKRVSVDTFRAQNRGGRGVIGISNLTKKMSSRTSSRRRRTTTCCSSRTRAGRIACGRTRFRIPRGSRRGTALVNLLTRSHQERTTPQGPGAQLRNRRISRHGHEKRRYH